MTSSEWLGVMKQAQDFPKGMEKLIIKYGEMLIEEHESKFKKLNIHDVVNKKELIKAFNKEMSELHCWFLPAEDNMIDEFLSNPNSL